MATLAQYMQWLKSQGGQCRNGIGADERIGMVPVTLLQAANGKYVIYHGSRQSDTLAPRMIAYFDSRLGVTSPFGSVKD